MAIDWIGRGNLGDVKSVGRGVSERRVDFGAGYRIYFATVRSQDGLALVVLLGGGSKQRQQSDVRAAQLRWQDYKMRLRRGEGSWR